MIFTKLQKYSMVVKKHKSVQREHDEVYTVHRARFRLRRRNMWLSQ